MFRYRLNKQGQAPERLSICTPELVSDNPLTGKSLLGQRHTRGGRTRCEDQLWSYPGWFWAGELSMRLLASLSWMEETKGAVNGPCFLRFHLSNVISNLF